MLSSYEMRDIRKAVVGAIVRGGNCITAYAGTLKNVVTSFRGDLKQSVAHSFMKEAKKLSSRKYYREDQIKLYLKLVKMYQEKHGVSLGENKKDIAFILELMDATVAETIISLWSDVDERIDKCLDRPSSHHGDQLLEMIGYKDSLYEEMHTKEDKRREETDSWSDEDSFSEGLKL